MKILMRGGAALCLALLSGTTAAVSQHSAGTTPQATPLPPGETQGFGAGKVLTFNYTQNFVCVEQPTDDLNFNGVDARNDVTETQTPLCQAGTNPTINPPGMKGKATRTTDPLYVLVPMFSVNSDKNPNDAIACHTDDPPNTTCGPALGQALIQFFGALPEAFKEKPLVFTQCPDQTSRVPGRCTMHASRIDLAPVLAALGYISNPPTMNVFVPDPNHSHLLKNSQINQAAEWWQVLPVLVLNANDWPPQDGSSGITSVMALKTAEKAGTAVEAPSNFFLYFSSTDGSHAMHMDMAH
jgi:hypothetical protein